MTARFPDRKIQHGEPCPWCRTPVGEVLTCSPPKCPECLGFLAPPLFPPAKRYLFEDPVVRAIFDPEGRWTLP